MSVFTYVFVKKFTTRMVGNQRKDAPEGADEARKAEAK
jgi:hypothetical protein